MREPAPAGRSASGWTCFELRLYAVDSMFDLILLSRRRGHDPFGPNEKIQTPSTGKKKLMELYI